MKMSSARFVPAPQQAVWDALNDPAVLKECVPGCESVDRVSDTEFTVQMTARVGPVSAKFKGRITLSDVNPPTSYTLAFDGQGGVAGFGKGKAAVTLSPAIEAGTKGTQLAYDVDAQVGGKLAQIGSRLVDGAAAKMADDFFERFSARFGPAPGTEAAGAEPAAASAPPSQTADGLWGRFMNWLRRLFGA
jgi:uncharacterized protein